MTSRKNIISTNCCLRNGQSEKSAADSRFQHFEGDPPPWDSYNIRWRTFQNSSIDSVFFRRRRAAEALTAESSGLACEILVVEIENAITCEAGSQFPIRPEHLLHQVEVTSATRWARGPRRFAISQPAGPLRQYREASGGGPRDFTL